MRSKKVMERLWIDWKYRISFSLTLMAKAVFGKSMGLASGWLSFVAVGRSFPMRDTRPIYGDDAEMTATIEEAWRGRHGLRMKLQRSGAWSRLIAILLAYAALPQPSALFADMIPVRHTEGLVHGFLLVLTFEGKALADGQIRRTHGVIA